MEKQPEKVVHAARVISDGVSNDKYVIGADLTLCKSKADANKRARNSAMCLSVPADEGQYIFALEKEFVSSYPGKGAFINALAVIGAVEKNAVIYHDLGNGMCWVAVVRGGLPLPGCDLVTTYEEGDKILGDYFEYVPNSVLIGSSTDSARTVETVLKKAEANKRVACVYKKPKSPYRTPLIVLGIVASVSALALAIQSIKIARDAAEVARAAAMAKLNESARIDAAIQQYNAEVRKVVEQARSEIAVTVPAKSQMLTWLKAIERQDLQKNGFRLDTVWCDVTECKLTWKAMYKAGLEGPDVGEILQRDDTSVLTSIALPELEKVPRLREDRLSLASRFHQLGNIPGTTFRVAKELAAIVVPTPSRPNIPPEMQAQLSAIQPVTVGHEAEVNADSTLSLIGEASALIGNSVTLKTIQTTPLTSTTGAVLVPLFKLTGSYVRLP